MRKPLLLAVLVVSLALLAAPLVDAGARSRSALPHRYAPNSLDGALVEVTIPDRGDTWVAWEYRNGAEYDIAISIKKANGFWSEPYLIGLDDGENQIEPSLAADARGNVYLAYAEEASGRLKLTWFDSRERVWSEPVDLLAEGVRGSSPALRVVGDRLVVGFRGGRGTELVDAPVATGSPGFAIFNDGPDPVESRDEDDQSDDGDDDGAVPLTQTNESDPEGDHWDLLDY